MLKTLGTMVAVGLVAIGVSSCGSGGGGDFATNLCNKLETCNDLTGISVQECKDNMNQTLNSETAAQRADLENSTNQCIAKQVCTDFTNCYCQIFQCTTH